MLFTAPSTDNLPFCPRQAIGPLAPNSDVSRSRGGTPEPPKPGGTSPKLARRAQAQDKWVTFVFVLIGLRFSSINLHSKIVIIILFIPGRLVTENWWKS